MVVPYGLYIFFWQMVLHFIGFAHVVALCPSSPRIRRACPRAPARPIPLILPLSISFSPVYQLQQLWPSCKEGALSPVICSLLSLKAICVPNSSEHLDVLVKVAEKLYNGIHPVNF